MTQRLWWGSILGVALAVGAACEVSAPDGGDFGPGIGDADAESTTNEEGDDTAAGSSGAAADDAPGTSAGESTSTSGDEEASSGSTGADLGPSFGSGSAFDDVMDMFAYINETREGYLSHERWRGLPWTGSGHTTVTWPTTFAWDEDLAAQAQAEADAIAGGSTFAGSPVTDGIIPAIYVLGVDSASYSVSGIEASQTWGVENQSSLSHHHGSARMAIYYHDPGGDGPVLSRLGIGAADAGAGDTVWVFVWE